MHQVVRVWSWRCLHPASRKVACGMWPRAKKTTALCIYSCGSLKFNYCWTYSKSLKCSDWLGCLWSMWCEDQNKKLSQKRHRWWAENVHLDLYILNQSGQKSYYNLPPEKKRKSLKYLSSHVLGCPTCFFSGLLGVLSLRREPRKNTKRKNPFIFLGGASQKLSASICNNLISKKTSSESWGCSKSWI